MNKEMFKLGSQRSIIRELFELSKDLKNKYGADKVYDFSIGNPSVAPASDVDKTLVDIITNESSVYTHGYTSSQGDNEAREAIAKDLNKRYGTDYTLNNVYMTCGAASSLSIVFKALTESSEDEIFAIAPYFTEYRVFVNNSGAKFRIVPADTNTFSINFKELENMINPNTKAIIINSPNNPTGVIYKRNDLEKLAEFLLNKEKEYNHPIYIVADEPYREIAYDGIEVPHIPSIYHNTLICYSYSKSLSLPGDRIGYVLVPNNVDDSKNVFLACLGAGRSLGYICAPSLYQHMISRCASSLSNIKEYQDNRNIIYNELEKIGYECVHPDGAFYLFVKALEDDSYQFMKKALEYNLVLVPSDDFGIKGYVRIAYCVSKDTILNSLQAFKELYNYYSNK